MTFYISSTCYATENAITACTPTSGQVTTSTGRKKRDLIDLVETNPSNKPVATLNGESIDFNELITPSRVMNLLTV